MARAVTGRDIGRHTVTTVETKRSVESILVDTIWLIVGTVMILLALRFLLLLLGANPAAPFTQFIYALTGPLMVPFEPVFGRARYGAALFDWSTLLAMVVYALVGWIITSLIVALSPRAGYQAVETNAAEDEDRIVDEPYEERTVEDDRTVSGDTQTIEGGRVVRRRRP